MLSPTEMSWGPEIPKLERGPDFSPLALPPAWCKPDHPPDGRGTLLKRKGGGTYHIRDGTACNYHCITNLEAAVDSGGDEFIVMSNTTWTAGVNVAGFSIPWLEPCKL